MANESNRLLKVGLLVGASVLTLMAFLFFIGNEEKTFSKKEEYVVLLESAAGLAEGNPVQMAGVKVGSVTDIQLPRDPQKRSVTIQIAVQKKYAQRIRIDSRAKLRKLGLIASDSYIDVTLGSPNQPILTPGSVIPSAKSTNVDALISSGGDIAENMVHISYSLRNVLERIDRGEGLLGELTTSPENKQRITDTMLTTLNKTNSVLDQVRSGRGLAGKLLYDDAYSNQLAGSLQASATSLQSLMGNLQRGVESGEGMVPALLSDPRGKRDILAVTENLRVTTENIAALTNGMKNGEGLVPRLMNDRQFADQTLAEFQTLVQRLGETVRKLNDGEGTAGRLIADPSIYESINDILIGINESKLLRWLVRNRQAKGIETRYDAAQGEKNLNTEPKTEPKSTPKSTPPPSPAPSTGSESTPPPPTDTTGTAAPVPPPADSSSTVTTTSPEMPGPDGGSAFRM